MARIKTAMEIALEKASTVKIDPKLIVEMEIEKRAGLVCNQMLEDSNYTLKSVLEGLKSDEKGIMLVKVEDLLLRYITLNSNYNADLVSRVFGGLKKIKDKPGKLDAIYQDTHYILNTYGEQLKKVFENLKIQFREQASQLKEQLGQQMGMNVDIDVSQHPEFQKYWTETKKQMETQLSVHLEQLIHSVKSLKNLY